MRAYVSLVFLDDTTRAARKQAAQSTPPCYLKSSMEQDGQCAKADNPPYFMITDMPMPWGQITSLPFATVRP